MLTPRRKLPPTVFQTKGRPSLLYHKEEYLRIRFPMSGRWPKAFTSLMIFRSHEWNYPKTIRGFGIALVGGMIIGGTQILEAADWVTYLQYVGIAITVIGLFYGMAGAAEE